MTNKHKQEGQGNTHQAEYRRLRIQAYNRYRIMCHNGQLKAVRAVAHNRQHKWQELAAQVVVEYLYGSEAMV